MTASFGNPLTEQRALLAGKAAVVLDARTILRVSGVDRLKWLHALLSQNIQGLEVGASAEALLLDPQGHVEQDIHLVVGEDSAWLIVGAERGESLLAWLERMIFRSQVIIADESNRYAVIASFGSPLALAELHWNDPWPATAPGGFRYAAEVVASSDWNYFENLVPIGQVDAVFADLAPAGTLALDALRVAAKRPGEPELDDRSLPHELDLLATAVHLSKGCYRGQETVAKVHNLGHPPRRITFLHLDGTGHELPPAGASVFVVGEDRERGLVTSAGQHFEAGPIALAVLSRSVPVDAPLEVHFGEGQVIAATQEVIVPPDAGNIANLAARGLTRRNLMGGNR
ncbi:MAG: hypothetical protein RL605_814 [Actinomycetota bacterium]|jgi:folate-binding protein YgfZ